MGFVVREVLTRDQGHQWSTDVLLQVPPFKQQPCHCILTYIILNFVGENFVEL